MYHEHMKKLLTLTVFSLFISSCAGGIPVESSKEPAGNPNGVITIQEFSDLQCPACRVAHAKVSVPLVKKYGDSVRFEWKHFPLRSIHRYAQTAAEASECAADQGKFWEYIDIVFEHQDSISPDAILRWAAELNLDQDLFERCWKSRAKKGIVDDDYKEGREMGVGGTPTFFVDGEQTPTNELDQIIEERLSQLQQRL